MQAVKQMSVQVIQNERTAGFMPSYDGAKMEGSEKGFSFFDLVDMLNPLQHIPVLNIAYRALTGDEIKPISQIVGGAVFGGPAGAAMGIANIALHDATGNDVPGHIQALASGRLETAESVSVQAEKIAYDDLPVALLSFAQMPLPGVERA